MSPIRRTKDAVYDIKYHFVWIPKYRKKILAGEVAEFTKRVFARIAREYEWQIKEISIQEDHVHLFHARRAEMLAGKGRAGNEKYLCARDL